MLKYVQRVKMEMIKISTTMVAILIALFLMIQLWYITIGITVIVASYVVAKAYISIKRAVDEE